MLIINNYQFWTFVLLKTRASFACNFTFQTLAVKNTTEPSDLRLKGGLLGPIQIVIAQSLSLKPIVMVAIGLRTDLLTVATSWRRPLRNSTGRKQCDHKKMPNVYKSCPEMISLEK